ncbi:uncharacterized protein LOC115037189 [Echeneis naucrates]|uniref:uncharacterized protein LOC115037189 n=1 Tax=Echeneis naucrates TaxID=173247 RepID=UPI001114253B|nr:uncharacterized protein LOC115037189 [Echeneis naucrates]
MKAHPEDLRPPCFLSTKSRPLPPPQRKVLNTETRTLEEERAKSKEREKAAQASVASIADPDWELHLGPPGSEHPSPISFSQGSLSGLSRPSSSLFSRSTDLASGRSSVLSADIRDSVPEGVDGSFPPRCSPVGHLPLVSHSPTGPSRHQPPANIDTHLHLYKPLFGQTKPLSSRPTSGLRPHSNKLLRSSKSTRTPENPNKDAFVVPGLDPSLDSDQGLVTPAFPSATWSSCPSPPRSGSGAKMTPSPPVSQLEVHHWPVLPPISPVRGRCGTAASRSSELSCSQSHVFDELEAIAPRSTSCPSLDLASDSSGRPSPNTELSPGLAALTVGCDSGNLGSLSRVQLLLLDRPEPETLPSPCDLEGDPSSDLDWTNLRMHHDPGLTPEGKHLSRQRGKQDPGGVSSQSTAGLDSVRRPLTAGSITERCDSAGKVQENKSDQSEGGSGSPSSWIIDPSPSYRMFRSSYSPCPPNRGTPRSSTEEGGPNYPAQRDRFEFSDGGSSSESLECRTEDEERKTKVLNMLSKLQDGTPHHNKSSKSCSNFEDFEFLAKYCIFSREKLDEYKRAFEAEDSDDDGYISCLQVLLALKNVIPPELLSDEEEIYVYRILEMVDFRVTDGLVDLRLFAVIASLAQKIATMDEFMRSLISSMDFRSLEVKLFKAKQLFLFLLEEQRGDAGAQQGFISAEQLLLELKAGGIHLEQEAAVRLELQRIPPLDLLDFLAYLPLFMLIHKSVISNPFNDSSSSVTAQSSP